MRLQSVFFSLLSQIISRRVFHYVMALLLTLTSIESQARGGFAEMLFKFIHLGEEFQVVQLKSPYSYEIVDEVIETVNGVEKKYARFAFRGDKFFGEQKYFKIAVELLDAAAIEKNLPSNVISKLFRAFSLGNIAGMSVNALAKLPIDLVTFFIALGAVDYSRNMFNFTSSPMAGSQFWANQTDPYGAIGFAAFIGANTVLRDPIMLIKRTPSFSGLIGTLAMGGGFLANTVVSEVSRIDKVMTCFTHAGRGVLTGIVPPYPENVLNDPTVKDLFKTCDEAFRNFVHYIHKTKWKLTLSLATMVSASLAQQFIASKIVRSTILGARAGAMNLAKASLKIADATAERAPTWLMRFGFGLSDAAAESLVRGTTKAVDLVRGAGKIAESFTPWGLVINVIDIIAFTQMDAIQKDFIVPWWEKNIDFPPRLTGVDQESAKSFANFLAVAPESYPKGEDPERPAAQFTRALSNLHQELGDWRENIMEPVVQSNSQFLGKVKTLAGKYMFGHDGYRLMLDQLDSARKGKKGYLFHPYYIRSPLAGIGTLSGVNLEFQTLSDDSLDRITTNYYALSYERLRLVSYIADFIKLKYLDVPGYSESVRYELTYLRSCFLTANDPQAVNLFRYLGKFDDRQQALTPISKEQIEATFKRLEKITEGLSYLRKRIYGDTLYQPDFLRATDGFVERTSAYHSKVYVDAAPDERSQALGRDRLILKQILRMFDSLEKYSTTEENDRIHVGPVGTYGTEFVRDYLDRSLLHRYPDEFLFYKDVYVTPLLPIPIPTGPSVPFEAQPAEFLLWQMFNGPSTDKTENFIHLNTLGSIDARVTEFELPRLFEAVPTLDGRPRLMDGTEKVFEAVWNDRDSTLPPGPQSLFNLFMSTPKSFFKQENNKLGENFEAWWKNAVEIPVSSTIAYYEDYYQEILRLYHDLMLKKTKNPQVTPTQYPANPFAESPLSNLQFEIDIYAKMLNVLQDSLADDKFSATQTIGQLKNASTVYQNVVTPAGQEWGGVHNSDSKPLSEAIPSIVGFLEQQGVSNDSLIRQLHLYSDQLIENLRNLTFIPKNVLGRTRFRVQPSLSNYQANALVGKFGETISAIKMHFQTLINKKAEKLKPELRERWAGDMKMVLAALELNLNYTINEIGTHVSLMTAMNRDNVYKPSVGNTSSESCTSAACRP